MTKEELRIVFLGTPDFAVATLDALLSAGYNVVGVITAPDRKGGRGRKKVIESQVKKYAQSKGLPILQPTNLKSPAFREELSALNAELQVVVAFRMLPVVVWDMPPHGTYNLHGSLLPRYRGAAPINWAVMNGDQYTGVTTFKLKHEIDTGSIAFQERIPIHPNDYLDDVHDRMKEVGANLMLKTVEAIRLGTIELVEQDQAGITKAPKIFHEDCKLDFTLDPKVVFDKVRGLSPFPGPWTYFGEQMVKVYRARYAHHQHKIETGQIFTNLRDFLLITCNGGFLFLDEIQFQGKKRMILKDVLNGYKSKESKPPYLRQIESPWLL